jgi:hypothetical protein
MVGAATAPEFKFGALANETIFSPILGQPSERAAGGRSACYCIQASDQHLPFPCRAFAAQLSQRRLLSHAWFARARVVFIGFLRLVAHEFIGTSRAPTPPLNPKKYVDSDSNARPRVGAIQGACGRLLVKHSYVFLSPHLDVFLLNLWNRVRRFDCILQVTVSIRRHARRSAAAATLSASAFWRALVCAAVLMVSLCAHDVCAQCAAGCVALNMRMADWHSCRHSIVLYLLNSC